MTTPPAGEVRNPFPGLRPFLEHEEHLFFGRESQVDAMVDKLAATRFLAVVGTSGSGKSSLVNCGLRPALQRGFLAKAGTSWCMVQFRPGNDPLQALAQALAGNRKLFSHLEAGALSPGDMVEAALRLSKRGLVDVYEQAAPGERVNLLVVVDQFEELFRYRAQSQETVAFANLLLTAQSQADCPIYVVLTMRSDFLGDCSAFEGLPEAINQGQYLIPRMTREERRAAIAGPIAVGGARITQVLLTRLVNDVGDNPDQLSILQHALNRTWAQWENPGGCEGDLDLPHYEATGTMSRALDRHADKAFKELPTDRHRTICEAIFKALTDKGTDPRGVRRPTRFDTLQQLAQASADEVEEVIDIFRKPSRSFLMPALPEKLKPESIIDISHESLMRVWERLKVWSEEEAQSAHLYHRLAETAALHAQGKSGLWRDPELQVALDWREKEHRPEAWAELYGGGFKPAMNFLDASEAQRRKEIREKEEHQKEALAQARALAEERQQRLEQAGALAEERRQRIDEQIVSGKRLQRWLAALAVVTVLTVIAFLYAAAQQRAAVATQRVAVEAQRVAEQKNSLANARLLASDALEEADSRLDLALLLEAEASRLSGMPDVSAKLLAGLGSSSNLTLFMTPGHAGAVRSLAYSPDGKMLASAGLDHAIFLWDGDRQWRLGAPLALHTNYVYSVSFRKDNKFLASCGADKTIRLWDVETGEPAAPVITLPDAVNSVSFSPDGNLLASAGDDGIVRLWAVIEQGAALRLEPRAELRGHSGTVYMVAFSRPDGRTLASAGADKKILLWDTRSRTISGTLSGHTGEVWSIGFSPDGKLLASSGSDNTAMLWDVASRRPRGAPLRGHTDGVFNVAFSRDGRKLASGGLDGKVMLWDLHPGSGTNQPQGRELTGYKNPVYGLAFSPLGFDDADILTTGTEDGSIIRWDDPSQKWLGNGIDPLESVLHVAFRPDGKALATASESTIVLWDLSNRDLANPQPLEPKMKGHTDRISGLAFSPNGDLLASASEDGTLLLWSVASRLKDGDPLRGHGVSAVNGIAFGPDGKVLASGGSDGTVVLWDIASRKPLPGSPMSFGKGPVWSLAWGRDKDVLASGHEDGSVVLWNVATRERIGEPLNDRQDREQSSADKVQALAFSPDGKTLAAAAGNRIVLWDVPGHRPLPGSPLTRHDLQVTSLAFSPEGDVLASASRDQTIVLWNVARTRPMGPALTAKRGAVNSLAFSPDGRTLLSGGDKESGYWPVVRWDFSAESWRSRACTVASRNLTEAEWARWFGSEPYHLTCPKALVMQADVDSLAGNTKDAAAGFTRLVALTSTQPDAELDNYTCFFGSMDGFAAAVMPACDRAVAAKSEGAEFYRDTRGLARAMAGQYAPAAEDFAAFVQWAKGKKDYEGGLPKRIAWIAALKEGRNPFDKKTLRQLRIEE